MGLGAADGAGSAKNLQGQLSEASEAVTSNETDLKTAEMRKKQYAKEVKETEKKLADARKSGGKQEKEYEGLMKEVAALRDQMTAIGYDESKDAEVQKQLASKTKERGCRGWQDRGRLQKELGPVKFQYSDPSPGFDRKKVKGTVAANLSVKEDKNNTALEAFAGGRLYQVIVDDEETGMQLLTKGSLSRRVTLIPLNKIRAEGDAGGQGRRGELEARRREEGEPRGGPAQLQRRGRAGDAARLRLCPRLHRQGRGAQGLRRARLEDGHS